MKRVPVLALLSILAVCGCGESPLKETAKASKETPSSAKFPTPEKTLEAIKAVDANREYSKFCQFFTAEAQRTLAGGLLKSGKDLKGYITNPDDQNQIAEEDKLLGKAVDELFKKHGVDQNVDIKVAWAAEPNREIEQTSGAEEQILEKMGERIADPGLFVADFIQTLRKHGRNPDARIIEENARLENMTFAENTAEGELVFTRDGREIRRGIGFQLVQGDWRISQVPDVFFK